MVMVGKPQGEMSEAPKKVDLGLLEEDDEFEEFPAEGKMSSNLKLVQCVVMLLLIYYKIKHMLLYNLIILCYVF